jgi:outer membrane lipoprotein-sorting protein
MKRKFGLVLSLLFSALGTANAAPPPAESAEGIVQKVLEADPWALSSAEMTARATLTDKRGAVSTMSFAARSRRYDPPFSKTLVRFSAPSDLAGAGFLQIQNRQGDDDRYLFLPDLKKSRRISGNLRRSSFMGTDFSFADLDRRDLREGTATKAGDEEIGKFPCFRVQIKPKRDDSPYARVEMWIRKDNYLPLKMEMYDSAGVLLKTFSAEQVQRVSGHWFVTRSTMTNHVDSHKTALVIEHITVTDKIDDGEFTVRALEKL